MKKGSKKKLTPNSQTVNILNTGTKDLHEFYKFLIHIYVCMFKVRASI
jgi:hypothetical protein